MTDRYARLNYGYSDERDCADYGMGEKPQECLDGSADAQYAVAVESMISNGFTFLTSSLIGSLSDEYGRKGAWEHGASARLYSDMLASAYYGPTPTSHTHWRFSLQESWSLVYSCPCYRLCVLFFFSYDRK
jgi:hypothetical protein